MKKVVFLVFALVSIIACSTDLSGIEREIQEHENRLASLDQKLQQLDSRTKAIESESSSLKTKSQELYDAVEELKKKSQELQATSEELKKQGDDLKEQGDDLKKQGDELKAQGQQLLEDAKALADSLDALRQKTQQLFEDLQTLQNEGQVLEDSLSRLDERSQALAAEWKNLEELVAQTQEAIEQLEALLNYVEPKILMMEFLSTDNPMQLVENTTCDIIGDSVIECRVVNVMSDKNLIPRFQFTGDRVMSGGVEVKSGVTKLDFSRPRIFTVHAGEESKSYQVTVSSYTGLPTIWVEVRSREEIYDNTNYHNATITLDDDNVTRLGGGFVEQTARIKGIGTMEQYISWDSHETDFEIKNMGKNSYTMVFTNSVSMLNEPTSKNWELMSNRQDLSLLRNQTAFSLSRMSKLDYTPRFHHVNLMLNGRYYGTYTVGDHLEVSESRVNVGTDGFILNVGASYTNSTDRRIATNHLTKINILAPVSATTESQNYIKNFLAEAENALYSANFTNPTTGWQKYMDIDSFVDWYLINEIAKNSDGAMSKDCIMHLQRGGKLKMGPVWNFENAFYDFKKNNSATGFVIRNAAWYSQLFRDPAFTSKLKERFNYFYNRQDEIINEINENAQYLKYGIQENENRWELWYKGGLKSDTDDTWVVYQGAIGAMKLWLTERMDWLKRYIDTL